APIKGDPVVKAKAEKHAGFELNYVSFQWDLEKMAEQQANNPAAANKEKFIEYMKTIVGEGQNIWFGTDGKQNLSVTAKDFTKAKTLRDDDVKGGKTLGDEAAYKDVRKQAPPETTVLALIDVPIYAETIANAMKPIFEGAGLPFSIPKPDVKGKTSYMAFS